MSIASQLKRGSRDINLPAALVLAGGERIECESMLRLFPGKRAVMRAAWRGRAALVKVFLDSASGRRNVRRELAGYRALKTAGLPTPELLLETRCADGNHVLAFAFIERAQRLGDLARASTGIDAALEGLRLLTQLHNNACGHTDPHLDNFLVEGARVYVVDVGSITRLSRAEYGRRQRDNLAFFLAQFAPRRRAQLCDALPALYPAAAADCKLPRAIEHAWRRRKSRYMRKCMRACSDFAVHKTWRQNAVWNRAFYGDELAEFLRDPDAYIADAALMKDGNSATVARARMDGREVVIKRNNIKDARHGLRRLLRPARSLVNWRNAHLLRLSGVATPQPLAFVEKRRGPLRLGGYYVSAFCAAPAAAVKYRDAPPSDAELQRFAALFADLRAARLCHGDLKASNLLVADDRIVLVDLDSLISCARANQHRQCAAKDRRRFLQNWRDKPAQLAAFSTLFAAPDSAR